MKNILIILLTLLLTPATGRAQTDDFESAEEAVKNMGVGWNLGNTLDSHTGYNGTDWRYYETVWSEHITHEKVMKIIHEAGFNTVRVPVTWYPHMDSEGNVDPTWMARVHQIVDYVIKQGMYCLLNVHHDTGAHDVAWLIADSTDYYRKKDRYEFLWRQISEEFKDYGEKLLFEGYNEMLDSLWSWGYASGKSKPYDEDIARSAYFAINKYAESFVNAVRSTGGNNLKRNLICSIYCASEGTAGNYNPHLQDPVKEMKMPEDVFPGHLLTEMHYYRNLDNMDEAKKRVDFLMEVLKKYLVDRLGVPVIIGEWGPRTSDDSNAYDTQREKLKEFARYFIQKTKEYGYSTCYWRGMTEREARLWPYFSQPELAEAVLKAYHGEDYEPIIPVRDDYIYDYTTVTYTKKWGEFYLLRDASLDLNEYRGFRLELMEAPEPNTLQFRVYRELNAAEIQPENKMKLTDAVTTFDFDTAEKWGKVIGIRLISQADKEVVTKVKRCVLIRHDGTEEETALSRRSSCLITDIEAHLKSEETNSLPHIETIPTEKSEGCYSLDGYRLKTVPTRKGIYIVNGKKVVAK